MKSTSDLLNLSETLDQVINDDLEGIEILCEYLKKRQQLEESFTNEISKFIATHRSNSNCMSLIYDEMHATFQMHQELSDEILYQYIPPVNRFRAYLQKEHKSLNQALTNTCENIKLYEKKIFIAKSQLERTQIEALHSSTSKMDKMRRNVKSLEDDLKAVEKEQEDHFQYLNEIQYPKFLSRTTELDFSVRTTIKNSMMNLANAEISGCDKFLHSIQQVHASSIRYEPSVETQNVGKSLGFIAPSKRIFAIVRCNYDSEEITDLRLTKGQFIEIIRQHPSGWWEGECEGRTGLFPMTFVELITDAESGALTIGETFEADGEHIPEYPDELPIDFGDILYVATLKDGWCEGYNIANGKKGKFPAKIIKHIKNLRHN